MHIEEVLKSLRIKENLTQEQVAEKLGIKRSAYASYETGRIDVSRELLLKVTKLYNVTLNPEMEFDEEQGDDVHNGQYSVTYNGEKSHPYLAKRRSAKNLGPQKKIPFFDAAANAGADVYYSEMTPVSAPSGTIDVGDLLSDSECALRVYGNSMIPNYPPGCVVGLIKCTKSFVEPGEVYVIETQDRRVIKRIFYKNDDPDTNVFTCYSDNILKFDGGPRDGKAAYPMFNVALTDVVNLFQVTGVIKRNTNSVIIHR